MTTKKKTAHLDEYAEAKKEITAKVKKLAIQAEANNPRRTLRFPVDGSRNYELESDGTLWMQYGDRRVATNYWESREWDFFKQDCKNGLWKRLEAFCK